MDEKEIQRIEYTERNEKNKIWQKKMKIYHGIAFGIPGVEILLFMILASTRAMAWLYVMGILFVIWFVWVIAGIAWVRCPHCDSFMARMMPGASHCPYCGTKLDVYPDLESPKMEDSVK